MSKLGKICLSLAFVAFGVLMAARLVLNGWHNGMWAPLGLFIGFFLAGLAIDRRFWKEFLAMRTTKHGLNMGVLILLALVFIVTVNFIAVRYEKKFDWTSEGLNSLSDQSVKAAKGLKSDVELVLLYRKEQDEDSIQRNMRDVAALYTNVSPKIKYVAYNALQRPDLAKKYEFTQGPYGVFLVSGERHIRIDRPTEEEITKALIKMGRDKKKAVYFTAGHGERGFEERKPESISELKKELESAYDVKTLTLYQEGKVPADADLVAVIGPQQQFLEPELQALREYAKSGGHLLLALDPGDKHNLAQLTKTFGVEFLNNYILDPRANIPGAGNVAALGTSFSPTSEITRSFQGGMMTIFLLASGLKEAPGGHEGLTIDEIVKTDRQAIAADGLDANAKIAGQGPHTLAVSVSGKLGPENKPEGKDFGAVIFGDSDFLSNALLRSNLNRDLALNAFAWLSKDQDLISIRPKAPKGTQLEMTRERFVGLILGFLFPLPVLLLIGGGVIWWRRRTA